MKGHGRAVGWESLWAEFIARAMEETKVTVPFGEHDIRAKAASDAGSLDGSSKRAPCSLMLIAEQHDISTEGKPSG